MDYEEDEVVGEMVHSVSCEKKVIEIFCFDFFVVINNSACFIFAIFVRCGYIKGYIMQYFRLPTVNPTQSVMLIFSIRSKVLWTPRF